MRRFFLPHGALDAGKQLVTITGQDARHISLVLRMKPGQTVEFFDGTGAVFSAVLQRTDASLIMAAVTGRMQDAADTHPPVYLAQALLKGKKMDFLVQKATELGVHTFMPIITRHCENHGNREHQTERWHRIMIEACKQCHRLTPMHINPIMPLDQAGFARAKVRLAAWEGEQATALAPAMVTGTKDPVCLFLGPEGGLHPDDLAALQQASFTTFSLGPRILRGETATLAALTIVQYLAGALQPLPAPASHLLASI